MEESRKQFEQWCRDNSLSLDRDFDRDGYFFPRTNRAWAAWKASRAALVVDLSDIHLLPCDKKDVTEALSSAGIAVKGEGDE